MKKKERNETCISGSENPTFSQHQHLLGVCHQKQQPFSKKYMIALKEKGLPPDRLKER